MSWKYVPSKVGVYNRSTGRFNPKARVTGTKLHPPTSANVHPGTAIRGDWHMLEVFTAEGRRTYGFVDGCIDSRLKMAVKLGPGQERDEVLAKWKNAPTTACGRVDRST